MSKDLDRTRHLHRLRGIDRGDLSMGNRAGSRDCIQQVWRKELGSVLGCAGNLCRSVDPVHVCPGSDVCSCLFSFMRGLLQRADHDHRCVHDSQAKAAVHANIVHQHGAGAALAVVAALLASRQLQALPQQVEQRGPGFDLQRVGVPIDRER